MFTDPKTTISAIVLAIASILSVLFKFVIPDETVNAIITIIAWLVAAFGLFKAKDATPPITPGG